MGDHVGVEDDDQIGMRDPEGIVEIAGLRAFMLLPCDVARPLSCRHFLHLGTVRVIQQVHMDLFRRRILEPHTGADRLFQEFHRLPACRHEDIHVRKVDIVRPLFRQKIAERTVVPVNRHFLRRLPVADIVEYYDDQTEKARELKKDQQAPQDHFRDRSFIGEGEKDPPDKIPSHDHKQRCPGQQPLHCIIPLTHSVVLHPSSLIKTMPLRAGYCRQLPPGRKLLCIQASELSQPLSLS